MGINGVTFDTKFAAYEQYVKTNAGRLGLSGQEIGEQLGRYSVGLQYDQIKAENKRVGRELAREIPKKNKSVHVKGNKSPAGLNVQLINEKLGIDAKPAGNASVYSLVKNEPAGPILHGNAVPKRLAGSSLISAADKVELVSWEPVKTASKKGFFSKIGKFFKGKTGKAAIFTGIIAAGVGLYGLLKSDKKEQKPLVDKLDDLKTVDTPENNEAIIANPDTKPEEKSEGKIDAKETPEAEKVPVTEATPDNAETDEAQIVEKTQEPDKPAASIVVPQAEIDEKLVEETKETKPSESKPVADTPKDNKAVEDNDKSIADNLKDQVKENNAQNKELRREIKSIRRHERLERRLENLQKRKEFKIEQQIKFEEQQALRQAKREAKASGNPERLTHLKQKQEIREIRQKGKEQIREIRFQTKQAVLEYKLSKTA